MAKKKPFPPQFLARATFANGRVFVIHQINERGGCKVIQEGTSPPNESHASSYEKAWSSIRYQAGISPKTQRTVTDELS